MPVIRINNKEYYVETNSILRDCPVNMGVSFPCNGQGVCGKCRVAVRGAVSPLTDTEKRLLSADEIASGVRLACCTRVQGDCTVSWIPTEVANISVSTACVEDADGAFTYGVAVDIGTTTVAAVLYDRHGCCLANATATNPQMVYGTDVLSRAQAAVTGEGKALSSSIRGCVESLLQRLANKAGIAMDQIERVVLTGNTAMLCLLMEMPMDSLVKAPFSAPHLFGETLSADQLHMRGLSGGASVYLPRCLDGFLGADFLCAMQSVGLCNKAETALLVDVGTNGEMALWHDGMLYACSTAAGPAFEGVGISCGMMAANGAVDCVNIVNNGLVAHTIGGAQAKGICGSGLLDAVACLLDLNEIDTAGTLLSDPYPIAKNVCLTREDVQAIAVSKSAIRSGLETLCNVAGIALSDVKRLYIAGGFGNALRLRSALRIGLIPPAWADRVTWVGNAALSGAARLLFYPNEMIPAFQKVELATNAFFANAFIKNMQF